MLGFWVRFVAAVVDSLSRVTCHYKLQGADSLRRTVQKYTPPRQFRLLAPY